MSKHTLSGVDLTNGKRINQTLRLDKDEKVGRYKNFKTLKDIKDSFVGRKRIRGTYRSFWWNRKITN